MHFPPSVPPSRSTDCDVLAQWRAVPDEDQLAWMRLFARALLSSLLELHQRGAVHGALCLAMLELEVTESVPRHRLCLLTLCGGSLGDVEMSRSNIALHGPMQVLRMRAGCFSLHHGEMQAWIKGIASPFSRISIPV